MIFTEHVSLSHIVMPKYCNLGHKLRTTCVYGFHDMELVYCVLYRIHNIVVSSTALHKMISYTMQLGSFIIDTYFSRV